MLLALKMFADDIFYFLSNEDYIEAFREYRIDEPVHKIDGLITSLYDDINVLFRFTWKICYAILLLRINCK